MQNNSAAPTPFFLPIRRKHLTEEELNQEVPVVLVHCWGDYTKRGEHRKEVITGDYEAELEVPKNYNVGDLKLAANRYVKDKLRGIRVRHVYYDKEAAAKPTDVKHTRKYFKSTQGLMDNESLKREYDKEVARRRKEATDMADGILPAFADDTRYGEDGLPKFSERTYVAQ